MTGNIEFLEEQQAEFVEKIEALLQRARSGESIGAVVFEMDTEGYLHVDHLGVLPDDRTFIGYLSEQIADCNVNMSLDAVFNAMETAE